SARRSFKPIPKDRVRQHRRARVPGLRFHYGALRLLLQVPQLWSDHRLQLNHPSPLQSAVWATRRRLLCRKGDFDQRAVADHRLQVVAVPCPSDVRQDLAPLRLVIDHTRNRRKVGSGLALEVKRELKVGLEVPQPATLPGRWHATDVDPSIDVVEHDLDPPRIPAPATRGGDVDGVPPLERSLDVWSG